MATRLPGFRRSRAVDRLIRVQTEQLDTHAYQVRLERLRRGEVGALVSFTGLVRDLVPGSSDTELELEHYPAMLNRSLEQIEQQARQRWPLGEVMIVHRVGQISSAEPIVYIGVSGQHRKAAFAACEYIIDILKISAPIWKKETSAGITKWVIANPQDDDRRQRWLGDE